MAYTIEHMVPDKQKQKDPTKHGFWHPPLIGPWNQEVTSLFLCGRLAPVIAVSLVWFRQHRLTQPTMP